MAVCRIVDGSSGGPATQARVFGDFVGEEALGSGVARQLRISSTISSGSSRWSCEFWLAMCCQKDARRVAAIFDTHTDLDMVEEPSGKTFFSAPEAEFNPQFFTKRS